MMNERQIRERIYRLKEEVRILKEVLNTGGDSKFGRPIGSYKYPDEQSDFLRKNRDAPMNELIKMFNEKFNTNFASNSRTLYNFMQRSGIITPNFRRAYTPKKPTTIDKIQKSREEKQY